MNVTWSNSLEKNSFLRGLIGIETLKIIVLAYEGTVFKLLTKNPKFLKV